MGPSARTSAALERGADRSLRRKGKPLSPRRLALMATVYPALAIDLATGAPADLRTIFPADISGVRLEIDAPLTAALKRVSLAKGSDGVMPPRGETLTPAQVAVLREWITAGAKWSDGAAAHWAYVKPARPAMPTVRTPAAVRPAG